MSKTRGMPNKYSFCFYCLRITLFYAEVGNRRFIHNVDNRVRHTWCDTLQGLHLFLVPGRSQISCYRSFYTGRFQWLLNMAKTLLWVTVQWFGSFYSSPTQTNKPICRINANHTGQIYNGLLFRKHFPSLGNKDISFLQFTRNGLNYSFKVEGYGETVFRDVTPFILVDLPHYTALHPREP